MDDLIIGDLTLDQISNCRGTRDPKKIAGMTASSHPRYNYILNRSEIANR